MRRNLPFKQGSRAIPAFTAALMAAGVLTNVQAQIQNAGTLFVNVDATALADGPVTSIPNTGTLGGVFAASGDATNAPVAGTVGGTKALQFDGDDFLQHLTAADGTPVFAPAELVGEDPTRSIEVWALNPVVAGEESLVSWGRRGGGPDGSNISFNYGNHFAYGAVGHWGNRDIGWNNSGGNPAANRWHHLVYTYDGTTTRVYADGVIANREYLGPGQIITHPDTTILIGAQTEGDGVTVTPGLRFTGAIARVRIHDGVLTPEQVAANYNTEKAVFIDPPQPEPPGPVTALPLTKPPVHRYSFSETAGDATDVEFQDSVGTAHGIVLGEGATFNGTRLLLPGGPSSTAAYGDLPNNLLSSNGVANGGTGAFTIESFVKVTGAQNWGRIFDFGSSGTAEGTEEVLGPGGGGEGRDYLMYSASVGTDVNNRRLEVRNEDPVGGGIVTVDNPTASFNSDTHLVVTWDEATGRLVAYENGVQVSTVTTDDKMTDINDVNVWLGRSTWTADANMQGEFDEVRLYDYVLSPGQSLGGAWAGPDMLSSEPSPVTVTSQPQNVATTETGNATFQVGVRGSSPISIQWLRDGAVIPGATAASYTLTNVASSDNNATFAARVSNTNNGVPVTVTSTAGTLTLVPPDTTTLKNRYSFNETSGSTIADSVGGADGTLDGGGVLENGELTLDGVGAYVNLPNGLITGIGTNGTIEMWITSQSSLSWARVFDFGISDIGEDEAGGGVDYLFFTSRTGDGFARFTANFPDGGDLVNLVPNAPAWLPGNTETHVAITWNASGNISRLFLDGELASTGTAPVPLSAMNGQDVNNWLGRSQFIADAFWAGKFNELRLHSGAMSPSQVQASFAAGPNSLPDNSAPPSLSAEVSGNNLIISWPASPTGFILEGTTAFAATTTWTTVPGETTVGDRKQVSVPLNGSAHSFYRLKN